MYAPHNLLTQWSRLAVGALASAGVTDLVVSPGSRSTPLVAAALQTEGLRTHSVLDERSAGFFALGLARASGRPAALLCTSGSALAHYLPALVEATMAGIPLVVLSADRPQELQHTSAPQTIQQLGVFGAYAKRSLDLGDARADEDNLAGLARKVVSAVHEATSGRPGPVHLNFPARKPLEPLSALTPEQHALVQRVDRLLGLGPLSIPVTRSVVDDPAIERLARPFRERDQLLVSIGPLPTELVRAITLLAERQDAYVFCETPGYATPVEGLSRLLGTPGPEGLVKPDTVVHFGPPPISAAWQATLKSLDGDLVVIDAAAHADASGRARILVEADVSDTVRRLARALQETAPSPGRSLYKRRLEEAATDVRAAIERETALAEYRQASVLPGQPAALSEPAAVARILASLPPRTELCLGNSLPVRLAAWVSPVVALDEVSVHTQRGAAGIDGLIAGASGTATATERPTLLLLGDVSAAHDLSSLALARHSAVPLCVCVLDNGGGRIFDQLPIAFDLGRQESFDYWLTPPRIDWESAARTYGVAYAEVLHLDAIRSAVSRALSIPSATLLVVRTNPESSREFLRVIGPAARPAGGLN